jgi:hypothetical protein
MLEADNGRDFDKGTKAQEPLQEYVIAFFDKYLKAAQKTILDKQSPASSGISFQKYGNVR